MNNKNKNGEKRRLVGINFSENINLTTEDCLTNDLKNPYK